jgi:energy-coupling factor transporter ATP-binding protein EcfA2
MDEPFAALDEITRHRLNDDLLSLWHGQDWTVVFVTHSVYESVYLSDRIIVMAPRPGRIVADIAVDEPFPRGEAFRTSLQRDHPEALPPVEGFRRGERRLAPRGDERQENASRNRPRAEVDHAGKDTPPSCLPP